MKLNLPLIIRLILNTTLLNAQSDYILNPSFEGFIGHSVCPPDWFFCNNDATPDTGPYFSDYPASDGNTYVGLVMRGLMDTLPKNEDVITHLIKPVYRDSIYFLSLDMALAPYVYDEFSGGRLYYDNPSRLRISGGSDSCIMEQVFYVSDIITDSTWKRYDLEVIPSIDAINYLKLEIFHEPMRASYIILDNLQFDELKILGNESVCRGDQNVSYRVPLGSGATGFSWDYSGTGVSIVGTSSEVFLNFYDDATSGNLTVTFNYGGTRSISLMLPITVDFISADQPGEILGPQEVCQGQQGVVYYPANANSVVYNWSFDIPGAYFSNYLDSVVVNFTRYAESGIIVLSGTNACSSQLEVTVKPLPDDGSELIGDEMVCQGEQNVFYAASKIDNATSYSWSFFDQLDIATTLNPNITIDFPEDIYGTFVSVRGVNECGLGYTSNWLYVSVDPAPAAGNEIYGFDRVCYNQEDVYYTTSYISNSNYYSWYYSGIGVNIKNFGESVELDFSDTATSGVLTVSGVNGCGAGTPSPAFPITIDSEPIAPGNIYGNQEVCAYHDNMFYIEPIPGVDSYYWTFSGDEANIQNYNDSALIYFIRGETNGFLTVAAENHCGIGELSPPLAIVIDPCYVNVPNSFSPNEDGVNDYFIIHNLNENSKMVIFDRLGKVVFETDNYQNDWNGEDMDGHKLPSDTYWYVFTTKGHPSEYKGFIYLKR